MQRFDLGGDDWKLSGWWVNQWRMPGAMETGIHFRPAVQVIAATVPGSVRADLLRAGLLDDANYALDSMRGEWVNNREWVYEKSFLVPGNMRGERYFLCFDGLDHQGEIFLNGTMISAFCGMFLPVEIDVTRQLLTDEANVLRVVFLKSPEVDGQFGYSNRIKTLKSRFNYIWDWCPRIIPVGIWEDATLNCSSYARITDFFPKTQVQDNNGTITAIMEINADLSGAYSFQYTVASKDGCVCSERIEQPLRASCQTIRHSLVVPDVNLWWPNTYGRQPLYEVEVVLLREGVRCDSMSKRIGFRHAGFEQNQNAPSGSLPYTLRMNGKRIFRKGVDWVPIRPDYGTVTRRDYKKYLQRLKDMNCNILRIWGGAILEKHDFYDLCDEMGLMVWQEFAQSSSGINNTPSDDVDLLKDLEKVSRVFVQRRRHHASHVVWCGGNELMWEDHRPVDERHVNIKMLKTLVEEMDPGKCFFPTSASGPLFVPAEADFGKGISHDVHGPWTYLGSPEHYRYFNKDDSLLRSETGCPGIARLESLRKYQGSYPLWPPDESNPYWVHRGAWWIQLEQLTQLFGQWSENDLKTYVWASRYLQAESLRYAAEATRRREPNASGFMIWMGNEPFPNNANTSVIEYDCTPKPAYCYVRDAFRSFHISLKYDKITYSCGEDFHCEVFAHNDSGLQEERTAVIQVFDRKGSLLCEKSHAFCSGDAAYPVCLFDWKVQELSCNVFFVKAILSYAKDQFCENTYCFTVDAAAPFEPLRGLPKAEVVLDENNGAWVICNTSPTVAAGVFLYADNTNNMVDIYPNYLTLMPMEKRQLSVTAENPVTAQDIVIELI